ncbi:MAG: SCP2 sterol-binding domain-containing protein [Gammaproteobacteria bacterium]|nr:SCP2 sterol-binding domain-containing protein [Gammaproteobacteria bacterium]
MIAVDSATIETRVLPGVARAIARLLEFDTDTRDALGRMSGRVIAVDLAGFEHSVYLLPQANGLVIRLSHDGEVHVRVRGSISGFVRLARSRARNEPVPAGTVEILGDLSTAQQVQSLIGRIDVDWEEMASRLIGDAAARKLGVFLHGVRRWAGGGAESLAMNFSEYVRYEIETVPERAAVEEFLQGVDALRADADRLAERVRLLRHRLAEGR